MGGGERVYVIAHALFPGSTEAGKITRSGPPGDNFGMRGTMSRSQDRKGPTDKTKTRIGGRRAVRE